MDYNQLLNNVRENNFDEDERKREEIRKWKFMPAIETANDISRIKKLYKDKTLKAQAKIVLRVSIPGAYDIKFGWSCYLELYIGNEKQYQKYASADYCESIFNDKEWHEEAFQNGLSFFSQNIEHKIKAPSAKKKKEVIDGRN